MEMKSEGMVWLIKDNGCGRGVVDTTRAERDPNALCFRDRVLPLHINNLLIGSVEINKIFLFTLFGGYGIYASAPPAMGTPLER